jgi:hypothetical protein
MKVHWNDENNRKMYLEKLFDDVYNAIRSQIDFHLAKVNLLASDTLDFQIREHAIQCNSLSKRYHPREDILKKVDSIRFVITCHM